MCVRWTYTFVWIVLFLCLRSLSKLLGLLFEWSCEVSSICVNTCVCLCLDILLCVYVCQVDLYLSLNSIVFVFKKPIKTARTTFWMKLGMFGFHRRFPLLWLTDLDLYILCLRNLSKLLGRLFEWSRECLDSISVSLYFDLPTWICISFLNLCCLSMV